MTTRIKFRRDTSANWASSNPVLALGEPGYDLTYNEIRIGDGVTTWLGLTAIASASVGNVDVSRTSQGTMIRSELTSHNGYIYFSSPIVQNGNILVTGSLYDQALYNDIGGHYSDAVHVTKFSNDGNAIVQWSKAIWMDGIPWGNYGDCVVVSPTTGNIILRGQAYTGDYWHAVEYELNANVTAVTGIEYNTVNSSHFEDAILGPNGEIRMLGAYGVGVNYANVQAITGSYPNYLGLGITATFGANSVPSVSNSWYIGGYNAGSGVLIDAVNSWDIYNPPSNQYGFNSAFTISYAAGSNVYSVSMGLGGSDYTSGEVITVDGNNLGGTHITNDLIITVGNVDAGAILDYTISGTAQTTNVWLYESTGIDFSATVNDVVQWNVYQSVNDNVIIETDAWTKTIGGEGYDTGHVITTDLGGNIYLGGKFNSKSGSRGNKEAVVMKLSSQGLKQWVKYVDVQQYEYVSGVSIDPTGNVVISSETADGYLQVAKMNPDTGSMYWRTFVGTDNPGNNGDPMGIGTPMSPIFDQGGNIIVVSNYGSYISNGEDLLLVKLNPDNGALIWQRDITASDNQNFWWQNSVRYITSDSDYMYFTPYNSSNDDALVIKLPIDGGQTSEIKTNWNYRDTNWLTVTEANPTITNDNDSVAVADTVIEKIPFSATIYDLAPYLTNTVSDLKTNNGGHIKGIQALNFEDGSVQTRAAITADSDYIGQNYMDMHIRIYNGGINFYWDGFNDVKWFDVTNAPSAVEGFRPVGAIIDYQLYDDNGYGVMIGTIHFSCFYDANNTSVTHTEHWTDSSYDGNERMMYNKPWIKKDNTNYNVGRLYFRGPIENDRNIKIQWTSKIFYGQENNC